MPGGIFAPETDIPALIPTVPPKVRVLPDGQSAVVAAVRGPAGGLGISANVMTAPLGTSPETPVLSVTVVAVTLCTVVARNDIRPEYRHSGADSDGSACPAKGQQRAACRAIRGCGSQDRRASVVEDKYVGRRYTASLDRRAERDSRGRGRDAADRRAGSDVRPADRHPDPDSGPGSEHQLRRSRTGTAAGTGRKWRNDVPLRHCVQIEISVALRVGDGELLRPDVEVSVLVGQRRVLGGRCRGVTADSQ